MERVKVDTLCSKIDSNHSAVVHIVNHVLIGANPYGPPGSFYRDDFIAASNAISEVIGIHSPTAPKKYGLSGRKRDIKGTESGGRGGRGGGRGGRGGGRGSGGRGRNQRDFVNGVDVSDKTRFYTGAELDKLPKEVKDTIWKAKADKGLLGNKKPRKVNAVENDQNKATNEKAVVSWGANSASPVGHYGWGEGNKGGKQGRRFGSGAYDDKDVTEVNNANGWTNKK